MDGILGEVGRCEIRDILGCLSLACDFLGERTDVGACSSNSGVSERPSESLKLFSRAISSAVWRSKGEGELVGSSRRLCVCGLHDGTRHSHEVHTIFVRCEFDANLMYMSWVSII